VPLVVISRRLFAATITSAIVLYPGASLAQDESAEPPPTAEPSAAAEQITTPVGDWTVTALDPWEQGMAEPLPGSALTLTLLEDGQLEGETACGRFTGGWSSDGAELFMGVAPTGNLGCGEQERAEAVGLSTALGAVTSWHATDGAIELRDALGTTRVVLGPLSLGDPTGEWSVVRFRRPNGEPREPQSDGPMSLVLAASGAVDGSSGCRALVGEYSLDGTGLTLGPLEVLGAVCEQPLARAERQLLQALGAVVYWRQAEDSLVLLDGFDEPVVELVRPSEARE
jgi:heat shock protein HslJ